MAQRILVVDDDQHLARLVRAYLEQAGYGVETAYDGEAALRTIRQGRPDLVILDLMLPDRDGWEITRLLRGDPQWQNLPIIMLTARVEDSDKILGLELGADDYITKPCNPREVLARVRTVLRRVQGPGPAVHLLEVGTLRMDLDRHSVTLAGRPVDLTPTEFGLLRVLLAHPEQVFARFQLIEQGLGYNYSGLERTIDTHIKNLRRKIEPDPAHPAYIQAVLGVGYRLADPAGAGHE